MADGQVLIVEQVSRVRTLRFNRPDSKNAFNAPLWDAATRALTDAAADPQVACVVLTGSGGTFCTGQDLREMAQPGAAESIADKPAAFVAALEAFDKPLLAAVEGMGIGIGLTMLGFCDIVVIAEDARLRAPFLSLGLTTEAASSVTLVERLGWQSAAHLLFTASWLDAATAVERGLAWRALPADEVLARTHEIAQQVAAMPIGALRTTKQLMKAEHRDRIRAASEREATAFQELLRSPAHAEALAAFAERRPPDFVSVDRVTAEGRRGP